MREELFKNEDPEDLLKPKDFAYVILRTINGDFGWGINLDINVKNIMKYIK